MVQGMDFVCLPVTDMARAQAFYETTLGLPAGQGMAGKWIEYEMPDGVLALINTQAFGLPFTSNAGGGVGLRIADVPAEVARLRAAGVAIPQDPMDTGVCHMAFLRDPDGNSLILHNRYAPEH